jgi:hypothetical protein
VILEEQCDGRSPVLGEDVVAVVDGYDLSHAAKLTLGMRLGNGDDELKG